MTVRLQQCDCRDHRRYNQDFRECMRQHFLYDLFGLLGQVIVRDQSARLLHVGNLHLVERNHPETGIVGIR